MTAVSKELTVKKWLLSRIADAPYAVRQTILGTAYLLAPRRLPGLIPLAATTLRDLPRIHGGLVPDLGAAAGNPDGLCGLAGRIDVRQLLEGYSRGMFVMSHLGPLKWWRPQRRMVLFFDRARIEKSVKRALKGRRFSITFDRAFGDVMRACASPRVGGAALTWITPQIMNLFEAAHEQGHAHSVEVWDGDTLVGGIYGLAVGKVFFTESQFHSVRDASKVGFAVLNRHLQAWGFVVNDGKHPTRYLSDSGMIAVSRVQFEHICEEWSHGDLMPGRWVVDEGLLNDKWAPETDPGLKMHDVLPNGSDCNLAIDELLGSHRSPTW